MKSGNFMSRLGKKIIPIPAGITVDVSGSTCTVKGPLGELVRDFSFQGISVTKEAEGIQVAISKDTKAVKAMWGTVAAHIRNMIGGVAKPYEKKLLIEGIGFKWDVKGSNLGLALGFSHPITLPIPEGIKVVIDNKGVLTVSGINTELVGEFTARIRALRKPEPYKGKGIRYHDEVIRRKQGKKTV